MLRTGLQLPWVGIFQGERSIQTKIRSCWDKFKTWAIHSKTNHFRKNTINTKMNIFSNRYYVIFEWSLTDPAIYLLTKIMYFALTLSQAELQVTFPMKQKQNDVTAIGIYMCWYIWDALPFWESTYETTVTIYCNYKLQL